MPTYSKYRATSPREIGDKTHILDEIHNILNSKLVKIELRIDRLAKMMKTLLSKNINFINEIEVHWIENPGIKLGGILDYVAILTVSGLIWMEAYINRNNLQ